MSQTTIRVTTSTRDALARIAAEKGESLDAALDRLIAEHDTRDAVDVIEEWYAQRPAPERAAIAALEEGDRRGWPDA